MAWIKDAVSRRHNRLAEQNRVADDGTALIAKDEAKPWEKRASRLRIVL
jgi:hypothetical protein